MIETQIAPRARLEPARRGLARCLLVALFLAISLLATGPSQAQCTSGQVTITTTSTVLANYVPTATATSVLEVTISVTNNSSVQCDVALSFPSTSTSQATMLNGTSSLAYVIENRANNKNLFYTGTAPVSGTDRIVLNSIGAGNTKSRTVDVYVIPLQAASGGTYTDAGMAVHAFNVATSGTLTFIGQASFPVSTFVNKTCTIAGAANTTQVIAVGSTGLTTGMTGAAPTFNVTCNTASNVSLGSQNGAVTRGGVAEAGLVAVSGFRNKIEYSASVNGGAGAVTLNTATAASVGPSVFNAAAVTNGATTVTITPETSSVPLVSGSYSDVLTVTISPQ